MLENVYQRKLIKKLNSEFNGCVVLKNDSGYMPGIPDLTVLHKDKWVMLEVKASEGAEEQPNQDEYVTALNKMSFAAFIYPENEEVVFDEIRKAFQPRGKTRVSKPKQVPLDEL